MKRKTHPYPNFASAVRNLAPTIGEIAAILGVSERSVANYLAGDALPHVLKVKKFPVLDRALSQDLDAHHVASIS